MATIDIGKIKPVFKGTYDGSTAYVLDDIVYYLGSSYVAKTSTTGNLPTDTTKWNILASGSGGIWDSTLSLGSANQSVKVNSGGTALEFGTISSDYVKLSSGTLGSGTANWSIDGHFSSTYKDYRIFVRELTTGNNGATMFCRMNTGGSAYSSSNYSFSSTTFYSTSHSHNGSNGSTYFRLHQNSSSLDSPSCEEITIFDPLSTTKRTQILFRGYGCDGTGGATNGSVGGAILKVDTAVTGITIYSDGGANVQAGAEYSVYGLK